MNKVKIENIVMLVGIFFLVCAAGMAGFYVWEGDCAKKSSEKLLEQARQEFSEQRKFSKQQEFLSQNQKSSQEQQAGVWAVLKIPELELELPVWDSYSEELLKQAVCRYGEDECEEGQIIIAGHSYKQHFRGLRNLKQDEEIILEFPEGERWYRILEVIEIEGTDSEGLFAGDWDLSLFTCNFSGSKRVVVRCKEEQQ